MDKKLVIFDADNTIWDTNEVFKTAQLHLLEVLKEEGIYKDLETLRKIDYDLFSKYGKFEYSFKSLCDILADNNPDISKRAYEVFLRQLNSFPQLLQDAQTLIFSIFYNEDIVRVMFTEGNQERVNKTLEKYPIVNDFFDLILFTESKNKQGWERAKSMGLKMVDCSEVICIGDSLKRDIKFANQAGMFTIYRPGELWGKEEPEEEDEVPSLYVDSLNQVISIL